MIIGDKSLRKTLEDAQLKAASSRLYNVFVYILGTAAQESHSFAQTLEF